MLLQDYQRILLEIINQIGLLEFPIFLVQMMTVTLCFVMMFQLITCSPDTCPMIRYIGSFDFNNHVKDHALFGSSYKNLTSNTVQQCFSMCIQDCRCVSYQMYDKQCQLIDENRQTVSDAHFMPISGYLYFELNQDFKNKVQFNVMMILFNLISTWY